MKVTAIALMDRNRAIGKNNELLVRIPEDLAYFKECTMGHHVVVGRKTYESIGRPLPGRTMVVVTHDEHYAVPEGVLRVSSLVEALHTCGARNEEEMFIAGGASVYQQTINWPDRLLISEVDAVFEGADAFFPNIDTPDWHLHYCQDWRMSKTGYRYRLKVFFRV